MAGTAGTAGTAASFVRMSKNHVNLGHLYQRSPRGRQNPTDSVNRHNLHKTERKHITNSVNLGNLYSTPRHQRPTGFAYFEDGSIFINARREYPDHDAFEADMKLLQPFVRQPSPNLDKIRRYNAKRRRLIVIAKSRITGTSHTILARNARMGERIAVEYWPFEKIDFQTDPSHSRLLGAEFQRDPFIVGYGERKKLASALYTFRGTLIDGVLQPHTILGNGLELDESLALNLEAMKSSPKFLTKVKRDKPSVRNDDSGTIESASMYANTASRKAFEAVPWNQKANLRKRKAELAQREQQLLFLQSQVLQRQTQEENTPKSGSSRRGTRPSHQQAKPASHDMVDEVPTRTGPDLSDLESRERELQHREEVLRWKRKTFILEQELAKARGNPPRGPAKLKRSTPSVGSPHEVPPQPHNTVPDGLRYREEFEESIAGLGSLSPRTRETLIKLPSRERAASRRPR